MCIQYTTKDIDRFWQKVDKRNPDECWEWLGVRKYGHGAFYVQGKKYQAHRVAYELAYGPIPEGLVVRHMCNFAPCCNPAHLQLGTQADNNRDIYANPDPVKVPIHPMPDSRPWAQWMGKTTEERFWARVEKTDSCWLWTGYAAKSGHGQISVNGKPKLVYRYSWELHNGPIPDGMCVCHNCPTGDNPRCVNPAHLFLGTQSDNIKDMVKKGRGRYPGRQGEAHHLAKVNNEQVIAIRTEYATGNTTAKALAAKFGISKSGVLFIVHGEHWTGVAGPETPRTENQIGENNPASKLTVEQVLAIRAEYAAGGIGFHRLSVKYSVSKPTIMRIINRESWRHV